MSLVTKIRIQNDLNLNQAILEAVKHQGGFEKFIKIGDVVLLKPNFNTADSFPASTDLEFLKIIINFIYDCGAKLVIVGDSCTMSQNTRRVMEKLGVFELEKMDRPPRIYIFEERRWIKKKISEAKYLKKVSITEYLDRADKLILLPCLKTHFQAQFTGSLKLSVGFMKPFERVTLHMRHLQEKIAELNKIIHPDLIIMDARKCFINKGPAEGEVRNPGLILVSTDRVALDIEGIKIIQSYKGNSLKNINPIKLPQIRRAIELGVGEPDK